MNKKFLLVAALCAAMNLSAYADMTNLALNKTAKASTGDASLAVDGNLESRWEVDATNEGETTDLENDYTVTKGHWLYVDLGQSQTFNTLRIRWQDAYAKEFKVLVADEVNAETGEPNWKEEAILTKSQTLTDFNKNYTYFLDQAVTARYVKVEAVKLGFAGNWFSMYELSIYNLTEDEKKPNITSMKASKEYVAPGEEFSVDVEDQFDNAMTGDDITYTLTNATKEENGMFKATNEGEVTITAKDKQNNEKTVNLTAYTPVLTTAKVYPSIVVTNSETPLTFAVKDQKDRDITNFTTNVTDNKFTATEDGEQEITITYGNETKKIKVYAVSKGADKPTLGGEDEAIFIDDNTGLTVYDKNWEGGYHDEAIIDINGDKVWRVNNVTTFGLQKNITETGFTTLEFDIFATNAGSDPYIFIQGTGDTKYEKLPFTIEAGKWNHISINVEDASKYSDYIKFKIVPQDSKDEIKPDILLDNVYLKKASATEITVGTADEKGTAAVKGQLTADKLSTLAETDGTAFDLTKLTIADDVTISNIKFKNPNAILIVPGSVDRTDNKNTLTYDNKWEGLTNAVLKSTDGYLFPIKQLQIADQSPLYRTFFVSAGSTGFKYSRNLKAQTYATVYLPRAIQALPEGVKAYEFKADDTNANNVILSEVDALAANVPYIVYNGNTTETTLECVSTEGDMDFRTEVAADKTTNVGNLNITGTYDYFKGSDKTDDIYGIQNEKGEDGKLSLKTVGDDAIVSPFRVYFTVKNGSIFRAIGFDFGGTTGIQNVINAGGKAKAGDIYSIDGKLVRTHATSTEGLAKGVYIINGKKVIVK